MKGVRQISDKKNKDNKTIATKRLLNELVKQ